jgi:vacuolar-type H+-ATPase subunit F/Vma7
MRLVSVLRNLERSKMPDDVANAKIAIIAEKYLATGFMLAGVAAFPVRDAEEGASEFQKLVSDDKFDVIILTEKLSEALKAQRETIVARGKARPVVAVVPDFEGPTGERLQELHALISQSVGAELKFKS